MREEASLVSTPLQINVEASTEMDYIFRGISDGFWLAE